ncbi:MAG TPA: hypothetical protein VE127_14005 [Solirubrobacteraceae bacterium]|nr:hypothetical protein [Solirubrobacteraceae bacterium]
MGRLVVARMLTTGSLVTAATAVRVGIACLDVAAERTPELVGLATRATLGGARTPTAEAAFRDELVALARDSAERSWRELRRGIDNLDALTRPAGGAGPRRPYRVKP